MASGWNLAQLEELIEELSKIRSEMLELEDRFLAKGLQLHEAHRSSARNLLHYLALRRLDLRPLQEKLASLGLSSLGRAESHVMVSVDAVLKILYRLAKRRWQMSTELEPEFGFAEAKRLLEMHTETLLGSEPIGRNVRIMVTTPSEAADDYLLVQQLLAHGMDCMRINCAHDDADTWTRMIGNLERAKQELKKDCRIFMDLAGPKLRTGSIEPGPQVIKWDPHRDCFGNVTAPARIWLTPIENREPSPTSADALLPVSREWLASLNPGDVINFLDARGSSGSMKIVGEMDENRWAESNQTTCITSGTVLQVSRNNEARVADLPAKAQFIPLKKGDTLILTGESIPGKPATYDDRGQLLGPATIGLTLPEILSDVHRGEAIWLDDGKIGGVISSVDEDRMEVEITQARPKGKKLKADKGINLPDSELRLPALTQKDIEDLPFIAGHADIIGYSFVRHEREVYELQSRLIELGGERLGIVLKIETRRAFERLPNLLLAAMRSPCAGVMIARGDLAIECGYERLAEVQEEILWISEAAHMPVIWATQVLEKLAKKGQPSRAEITDAAMGERAECVMLNKGRYIVEAVQALDEILKRMQAHQSKKNSMLRQLRLADKFCQTV